MNKMRRLIPLLFTALLLTLAACTETDTGVTPTGEPQQPLANTAWTLVSFGPPGEETPVTSDTEVTLFFEDATQATGSGGCNSFGSEYVVQNGAVSFGDIESTLVACEDEAVMDQEERYFQALSSAGEYEISGDRLTIWYDEGQGALNFTETSFDS